MKKIHFADLHIHTEFSRGKSMSSINELIQRAVEFKMPALAISDSESLSGIPEFYLRCKGSGIKPILGAGFNFCPNYGFTDDCSKYHIVLLAKSKNGYKNLLNLISASFTETTNSIPRIDMEILAKYSEDLICLSGGFGGVFDKLLREDEKSKAIQVVEFFLENFDEGDFYIEIQDHEFENNKHEMIEFVNFSLESDIPLVVTGGSFYVMKSDAIWCNEFRRNRGQNELEGNSYYFKSPEEIADIFHDLSDAIANTITIAEKCNVELDDNLLKQFHFTPDDDEMTNIKMQLDILFNNN